MTRFILSLMMLILVMPRVAPARESGSTCSTKRTSALCAPVEKAASEVRDMAEAGEKIISGRLARLTAYWSGEGDYYTRRHLSATGVRLHSGHCAVDPSIIPYGSVVQIAGLGNYLAVDTGTAVVSRRAAREAGHNRGERNALVIDLYFENRRAGEAFAANGPKYASISWSKADGTTVIGMSRSDVTAEAPVAAAKPVPAGDNRRVAAARVTAAPSVKLAATKPKPQPAAIASVKTVSKHDTRDTAAAPALFNSKGEVKLASLGTRIPPVSKVASNGNSKPPVVKVDEQALLAQSDASAHHKSLYQF